jgi:hypothetical protein
LISIFSLFESSFSKKFHCFHPLTSGICYYLNVCVPLKFICGSSNCHKTLVPFITLAYAISSVSPPLLHLTDYTYPVSVLAQSCLLSDAVFSHYLLAIFIVVCVCVCVQTITKMCASPNRKKHYMFWCLLISEPKATHGIW